MGVDTSFYLLCIYSQAILYSNDMPFLFFQEHFEKEKENSQFVSFLPSLPPTTSFLLFFPALVAAMQMESGTSCVMWVGWLDPILQKYLK